MEYNAVIILSPDHVVDHFNICAECYYFRVNTRAIEVSTMYLLVHTYDSMRSIGMDFN